MSYRIELEAFNGPMDLLLYLISKEEVDITEVSIASIVDQYMEYLEKLRDLNVNIASDFIVMAATLMLIKSKTILPTEEIDLEEEIGQQDELIQHLLEYKKIKVLSRGLQAKADHHGLRFPGSSRFLLPIDESVSLDEANLWDILHAFAKIIKETDMDRSFRVIHSERPLSAYIATVLEILKQKNHVPFVELFAGEKTRGDAVSIFVGLLELMKRNVVTACQQSGVNEIYVTLCIDGADLEEILIDGVYRIDLLGEEEEEEEEEPAVPWPEEKPEAPQEPEALQEPEAPQEEEGALEEGTA